MNPEGIVHVTVPWLTIKQWKKKQRKPLKDLIKPSKESSKSLRESKISKTIYVKKKKTSETKNRNNEKNERRGNNRTKTHVFFIIRNRKMVNSGNVIIREDGNNLCIQTFSER